MESSKHNDELIKRKLANVSVEPRKLKFAEVHANYEKARKASANRWGLYFIIGTVGIAALVGAYLLTSDTSDQLAENTVAKEYSASQNIQPVSEAKTNVSEIIGSKTSETPVSENIKEENKTAVKETSAETSSNDLKNISNINAKANSETKTKEITSAKKGTSADAVKENSNKASEEKRSAKKISTSKPVEHTSSINNDLAARTKNSENKPVIKGKVRSAGFNDVNSTKKPEASIYVKSTPNSNETNSNDNSGVASNTKENTTTKSENSSNTKTYLASENKNNTTATEKQEPIASNEVKNNGEKIKEETSSKDPDNKNVVTNTENAGKDVVKNEIAANNNVASEQTNVKTEGKIEVAITKTEDASNKKESADTATAENHIPGVIGTGSVSPRNKHKFLVGAEVSYSTLFYNAKENPNAPSQFSTGDPAFTTAYANAVGKGKHSLFNGAASLSYVYNEGVGISAGVSYFNLETKVGIQPSRTPQYATVIDYFVWNWVPDSSTLILKIVDTVYKQVATGNYNTVNTVVNGDTASTSSFVNKIRYLSIPLNISYNFKIGAKFSIEPQAGIIYTMPLRSSHLVATDAYKFDHSKQKTDLRSNLYFNTALKFGYNISNKMEVYVRQGYFFRNQSIYNGDQAISLSLKSVYTSFGISFRIK